MLLLDIISIALVIIILVIIISHLSSINKKLDQKIKQEKNRFILYKNRLWELDAKQILTKKDMEILSKLARDFFKERFNLSYNLSYVELSDIFRKEGLDKRVEFCDKMSQILYAGEKLDTKELKELINLLLDIIEDYKYI
jgi:hypothetical protein